MRRIIQALTIGGALLFLAGFGLLSAQAAPAGGPAAQPNRPTLTPAPPATARPTLAPTSAPGATATPKTRPTDSGGHSDAQPTATAEPTATAMPSATAAPSATATAAPAATAPPPASLPKTGGAGGADLLLVLGAVLALAGAGLRGAGSASAKRG